ncbi:MAG TPA: MFS transporter [Caulobacteraceae bacterium]|jgi:MFS family permease
MAEPGWRNLIAEGRAARLALICLGVWLNAADSMVTTTIMPTIGRALGGYTYFSWATAAYMVGAILSGATAARLSARTGLRNAMMAAGLLTAVGCAVSALAPSMLALVAGRWVQGLGAGWVLGACYAALGAIFPARHLPRVFGLMTSIWGVALVLGPIVGALFAQGGHWRGLFWAFALQCLAFVAASGWLLRDSAGPVSGRTPWAQLALVLAGVGLVGAADLVSSAIAAGGLCVASLAVFVLAARWPTDPEHSLFPREAGDPRSVIGAAYISFFALTAAAAGFSVYGPAILQKLYGFSPLMAGYAVGLESAGWTGAALLVAGLPERWHAPIIRLGGVCVVVALAMLAVVMRGGPLPAILVAAAVLGAGFGLTSGYIDRRVIAAAPEPERELASAGINSVRQVGNAAGACFAGIVANLAGLTAGVTLAGADTAAVWLFALAAPLALVGAVACWRVAEASVG